MAASTGAGLLLPGRPEVTSFPSAGGNAMAVVSRGQEEAKWIGERRKREELGRGRSQGMVAKLWNRVLKADSCNVESK